MQALDTKIRTDLTNFEPPESEASLLQCSFVLDAHCTQPMVIYHTGSSRGLSRLRRVVVHRDLDAELADYVERMAGTEFDLDAALEAASIEHIVSADDE